MPIAFRLLFVTCLISMTVACMSGGNNNDPGSSGGKPAGSNSSAESGADSTENTGNTDNGAGEVSSDGNIPVPDSPVPIYKPPPVVEYHNTVNADVTVTLSNCDAANDYQFEQVRIQHAFAQNSGDYDAQLVFSSSQSSHVFSILLHNATIDSASAISGNFSAAMQLCDSQFVSRGDISGFANSSVFSAVLTSQTNSGSDCDVGLSVNLNLDIEAIPIEQPVDCGEVGTVDPGTGTGDPTDGNTGGDNGGGSGTDTGGNDGGVNDGAPGGDPSTVTPIYSDETAIISQGDLGSVNALSTLPEYSGNYSFNWALNASNYVYLWINQTHGYYIIVLDIPDSIQTIISTTSGVTFECRCLPQIEKVDDKILNVVFDNLMLMESKDFDLVDDFVILNGALTAPSAPIP